MRARIANYSPKLRAQLIFNINPTRKMCIENIEIMKIGNWKIFGHGTTVASTWLVNLSPAEDK